MSNKSSIKNIDNDFSGKDIVSLSQFDTTSLTTLFNQTQEIITRLKKGEKFQALQGKIATLLFFEPSSRTFSSFSAAVKRLDGQSVEYQDPLKTSSAKKGETLEDTIKVFEQYSDVIIMRHPERGAAKRAAEVADIPVINAGDGPGEHPTQGLLDLFTIYEKFGRLDGLKIVMAGDLLYGRTVRSLLQGLALYPNNTVYLLSPERLKMGADVINTVKDNITIIEGSSDKDLPNDANVWYWTRVQEERFESKEEYDKVKNSFILTQQLLTEKGNNDMIIMHPLPRVNEIEVEVDADPRAHYFHQVKNGMYVRMALLDLIMNVE